MTAKDNSLLSKILYSDTFDKEKFMKIGHYFSKFDSNENKAQIIEMLQKQYMELDINKIADNHDINEIIDFLNRLIASKVEYDKIYKTYIPSISLEEVEEFKRLAEETSRIPKEELSREAPVLTTRSYLDMCRVVYDATEKEMWNYPDDISTGYLFCSKRIWDYGHEYNYGILGFNWDSPEEFKDKLMHTYHYEELWFGGPDLLIDFIDDKWIGTVCGKNNDKKDLMRSIRMYVALRKKNYPVYYSRYEETYNEAKRMFNL